MSTEIAIKIDGLKYTGWERVTISRTMEELCGRFDFGLSDFTIDDASPLVPGKACEIVMKGDVLEYPIMTGYIDQVMRVKTADKSELTFVGRDKTEDIIDCSSMYKTSTWKKAKVSKIITDLLSPYDIQISHGTYTDEEVERFTLQNSESIFETIERLSRAYGIWLSSDEAGRLLLSSVGSDKADVRLEIGQNAKSLACAETSENRYSEYIFRGQNSTGGDTWTKANTQLRGVAFDAGVSRTRILIIEAEKKMDYETIRNRARWEAQYRAGSSIRCNVEVRGWMQDRSIPISRPWKINEIVEVKDESWDINAELLVSGVEFSDDEQKGRMTNLTLVPPEIYQANPGETIELARKSSVRPS